MTLNEGTLYVAPIGVAGPDMTARDGRFAEAWGPPWLVAGPCDFGFSYDLRRDVFAIDMRPAGPGFRNLHQIASSGTGTVAKFAIGFESLDGTRRYLFPVISGVKVTAQRASPSLWEFMALGEDSPTCFTTSGSAMLTTMYPPPSVPIFNRGGMLGSRVSSKPYGGESVEMVPGRLRGFRQWAVLPGVDGSPPRLAAITAGTVWPWTPVFEAHCHRAAIVASGQYAFVSHPPHPAENVPDADCSCGIYAKHRPHHADGGEPRVLGVIEAWGKVEIGENGFRARYARLVALAAPSKNPWWPIGRSSDVAKYDTLEDGPLPALGELYRVPVFAEAEEMWEKYPPGDVSELLGRPKPETPAKPGCYGCAAGNSTHSPTCPKTFQTGGRIANITTGPGQMFIGPGVNGPWKPLGYTGV